MANKLIIINGVARSGKDTFIDIFKSLNPNTINISSIDKVKELAREMGWDGTKDDKSRKFLSDLKDLWTDYNNNIFFN